MRYDPVLFDLDGTVVDSGAIILASLRHATQTVLGETIPDERLLATVGGSGLASQMRDFDPERVEELVRVYTEHNRAAARGARPPATGCSSCSRS